MFAHCRGITNCVVVEKTNKCTFGGVADKIFATDREGAKNLFGSMEDMLKYWENGKMARYDGNGGPKDVGDPSPETVYKMRMNDKQMNISEANFYRTEMRYISEFRDAKVPCVNTWYYRCQPWNSHFSSFEICPDN